MKGINKTPKTKQGTERRKKGKETVQRNQVKRNRK